MLEELVWGPAEDGCSGEGWEVELGGWGAPLGGLVTRGSSSEELSSDAPRMNLRRSLASGPELSIGTRLVRGNESDSEFPSEDCERSERPRLTSRPAVVPSARGLLVTLCVEVVGTVDRECLPGWRVCAASSAAGRPQWVDDSSPFTGIAAVLVLILHSSTTIHRINPNATSGSIHRHPPETATTT